MSIIIVAKVPKRIFCSNVGLSDRPVSNIPRSQMVLQCLKAILNLNFFSRNCYSMMKLEKGGEEFLVCYISVTRNTACFNTAT